MGLADWWRSRRKNTISQPAMDKILAGLQEQEAKRKASRPEMTLPSGERLYFEESEAGDWCWTSDIPVVKEPGGREFTLVIHVDEEGDHPTGAQLGQLREVQDQLPDLLRQFRERLPKECLEFDVETIDPPATFEELGGWELWFEAPSSEDGEWEILCHMTPDGTPSYSAKFVGLVLEKIEPCY